MTDRLEERVAASLADRLDRLDTRSADLPDVVRRGGRLRTGRRAFAAGLAAVVVVGGVVLLTGQDQPRTAQPAPSSSEGWTEVARSPLSPRWQPVGVWTGEEVLFVGGGIDAPCPPAADCVEPDPMGRDGAAYDPRTDTWRRIADAPVPIGYWFRPAAVGDRVVLLGSDGRTETWLSYDVRGDVWSELPPPPESVVDQGSLTVLDGEVYVLGASRRVLVLDPVKREWRRIIGDPHIPELEAETVVATPEGVFVTGPLSTAPTDGDTPRFVVVDRWDGRAWTRYPQTGQIGSSWHWTGERLVGLDPQVAPGLTGRPPYGGVLEPATGTWSPLPNAPDVERERIDGWSLGNAAEGPLIAGWGAVYDDRDQTWTPLGRPRGTSHHTGLTGVWADGRIVAFGGLDERTGYRSDAGLSNQAWVWAP